MQMNFNNESNRARITLLCEDPSIHARTREGYLMDKVVNIYNGHDGNFRTNYFASGIERWRISRDAPSQYASAAFQEMCPDPKISIKS